MKSIIILSALMISFSVTSGELSIPQKCDEYLYSETDDRRFNCCCTITYEKNNENPSEGPSVKYINLEFYASILAEDITAEDLLEIYFSFDRWREYAQYDENSHIIYNYSNGTPARFSPNLDTLIHDAHYTIYSSPILLVQSFPYNIVESTIYRKRATPATDAIASYDFSLREGSNPIGIIDKWGSVHVAESKKDTLLLVSKFNIKPRPIAELLPGVIIQSMNYAFEDLLKGMLKVEYGCENFIKENISK
ncbi:MAG: hypothetical protein OXB84_01230 [Halobacteriovoraceae bacterium]|nr:hypothetical protein [Halobacteriovoraceae bacterium]